LISKKKKRKKSVIAWDRGKGGTGPKGRKKKRINPPGAREGRRKRRGERREKPLPSSRGKRGWGDFPARGGGKIESFFLREKGGRGDLMSVQKRRERGKTRSFPT